MTPNHPTPHFDFLQLIQAYACEGDLRTIATAYSLHPHLGRSHKSALRPFPAIMLEDYFPTRGDLDLAKLRYIAFHHGDTWSEMADNLRKHAHDHARLVACTDRIVARVNDYHRPSPTVRH